MYPGFENDSPYGNEGQPNKQPNNPPKLKKSFYTKDIEYAILELQSKFMNMSVKPYLNAYEAILNLPLKGPVQQLPIKIVLLQKFPQERPYIYVAKPYSHQLINEFTGEIMYENFTKWNNKLKVSELVQRIQNNISNGLSEDKFIAYLDGYKKSLEMYTNKLNAIAQSQIPNNPPDNYLASLNIPPPPALDFSYVLRQKSFQEQLQSKCEENSAIYQTLLSDYKYNESKAKYISERFGKGRILKELYAATYSSEIDPNIVGIENQLNDFFNKRKRYHRMYILKQKYLES